MNITEVAWHRFNSKGRLGTWSQGHFYKIDEARPYDDPFDGNSRTLCGFKIPSTLEVFNEAHGKSAIDHRGICKRCFKKAKKLGLVDVNENEIYTILEDT